MPALCQACVFWRTRPRLYSEEARTLVGSLVGKAAVCRDSEGSVASGRLDKGMSGCFRYAGEDETKSGMEAGEGFTDVIFMEDL